MNTLLNIAQGGTNVLDFMKGPDYVMENEGDSIQIYFVQLQGLFPQDIPDEILTAEQLYERMPDMRQRLENSPFRKRALVIYHEEKEILHVR